MAKKVRYRVTGAVFVNGSYIEPAPGKEMIIEAAPGLEGRNLKLVQGGNGDKPQPPAGGTAPTT